MEFITEDSRGGSHGGRQYGDGVVSHDLLMEQLALACQTQRGEDVALEVAAVRRGAELDGEVHRGFDAGDR